MTVESQEMTRNSRSYGQKKVLPPVVREVKPYLTAENPANLVGIQVVVCYWYSGGVDRQV
jgi:hypothetical protein